MGHLFVSHFELCSESGLSHRFLSTIYSIFRVTFSIFRVTYCVKHNIISVIFNDTVEDDISRGVVETKNGLTVPPLVGGRKYLNV